jgi:chromate transporter
MGPVPGDPRTGRTGPAEGLPGPPDPPRPPRFAQLRAWLVVGSQSVGGGATVIYLMRERLQRRTHWLTPQAFLQEWTLSRISPGMQLVTLAALLGHRIGGRIGVPIALVGILLPSATMTALIAAAYLEVGEVAEVQAAFRGMGPLTLGLTAGVSIGVIVEGATHGRLPLSHVALVVAAGALWLAWPTSPVVVIGIGAVLGALFLAGAPTVAEGATIGAGAPLVPSAVPGSSAGEPAAVPSPDGESPGAASHDGVARGEAPADEEAPGDERSGRRRPGEAELRDARARGDDTRTAPG